MPLTAIVTAVGLYVPLQVTLVLIGLLIAVAIHNRTGIVVFAVMLAPTLGFVRRIAAGPTAYTASDPLILLPLLLIIAVVVYSWSMPRTDQGVRFTRIAAGATIAGVLLAIVLRTAFDINGIFFSGLIAVPLLLAVAISTGRMSSVWPAVSRVLPGLAFAVATYGIFQFFFLPSWDRAWMISSGLTSIGQPEPLQVRVFGSTESPGPFALFLGLAVTFCVVSAVIADTTLRRFGWVALAGYLVVPLILSGVRSALLCVGLAVALLAVLRARGIARVLLPVFLLVTYQVLMIVIGRFGGGSTILNANRYTQVDVSDDSLVARLGLLRYLANPFQYVIGNPEAPATDNLFIDALIRYGLLAALGLLALYVAVLCLAIRNLVRKVNEIASVCAIFIVPLSMFGPSFNSLFGIVIGVVFGTVMASPRNGSPAGRTDGSPRRTRRDGQLARRKATMASR